MTTDDLRARLCDYHRHVLAPYLDEHAGFPHRTATELADMVDGYVRVCCDESRGHEPPHWFGEVGR